MDKLIIKIFEIDQVKRSLLIEWSEYLKLHKNEVVLTLDEENMLVEGCNVFTENNKEYCIIFGLSGKKGLRETNLNREINVRHKEVFKEIILRNIKSEQLYFFGNSKILSL